jgi:hypothetical protein
MPANKYRHKAQKKDLRIQRGAAGASTQLQTSTRPFALQRELVPGYPRLIAPFCWLSCTEVVK